MEFLTKDVSEVLIISLLFKSFKFSITLHIDNMKKIK